MMLHYTVVLLMLLFLQHVYISSAQNALSLVEQEEEQDDVRLDGDLPPMFVLNLDRAKKRWQEAEAEMAKHGLVVNRMPAVDGRALSREELSKESTKMATYLQPRGVIGCYLSHKRFWQMVVDKKYESAIVFEDDVHLVDDFKSVLISNLDSLKYNNQSNDYDVILLGAIGRVHPDGKDGIGVRVFSLYIGGNRQLQRITENLIQPIRPAGTHAYIVSYEGAKKLLKLCNRATFHVDLDAWRHSSLKIRMFDPMLAYQTFESTSLTELNEREKSGPRKYLKKLVTQSAAYRKFINWMVEPYTHQPWSHVMDEPLMQFGPNGLVLTVKRHLAVFTTGLSLAALLQYRGYRKSAFGVIGVTSLFVVLVRSTIWILMNWK